MSSHRLRIAVAGGGEWESGNRLLVEGETLRIARAGALGRSRLASRPAASVVGVLEGPAGELLAGSSLGADEHVALTRAVAGEEGAGALVLRFEDPEQGRDSWLLAGDPGGIAACRQAVEGARGVAKGPGAAEALEEEVPVPERAPATPGAHRAIIAVIGLILVALVAAVVFAAVRYAGDLDLPGGGGDDTAEPSSPSAPPSDDGPDAPDSPEEPEPETPEPAAPTPYGPGGLVRIEREVAGRVGTATPRYVSIIAADEYVIFAVFRGGREVDSYTWREGDIIGPAPVRITGTGSDTPGRASFTRKDVRLAAMPRLARRAERIPLGGNTTVSTTVIQRFLPFQSNVVFLVNVTGDRDNAQLRANARGQVTGIV